MSVEKQLDFGNAQIDQTGFKQGFSQAGILQGPRHRNDLSRVPTSLTFGDMEGLG